MSLRRLIFGAVFGLGLAARASAAEPPPVSPQFQKFILLQENRQAVVQSLQAQWTQFVGVACANVKPVDWQVEVLDPVDFRGDGKPLKGSWKETVTSEGCGFRKVFTVVSAINTDGTVKHIDMLPGTSHADPFLERDAIGQARAAAASILPKECQQVLISDTAFVAQEGEPAAATLPGRDPHPWREEWTLKGCNATAIVTLHFVPDAKGTGIHAAVNESRPG
ncbi:MAG TPA: hypothetical protein VGV37_01595 [Aliidongia sp.]|uniref:hypothetical protein n=1 Tax=Aliidongia sp. TaxID=1914230 RepID=UPI002DDD552F|nr:hypothetical protein [Aliidongia sp.]HEV2673203.1 hypothetical protein [Aliidongia sp.]